jgi:hypothetical protein
MRTILYVLGEHGHEYDPITVTLLEAYIKYQIGYTME